MMPSSHSTQLTANRFGRREFLGACAAGVTAAHLAPSLGWAGPAADARPAHTAPLAMWALTGTLKSADVDRQLDAFAEAGWGAVLYPRWGLELEYLGDAWFERIRYIVEQAASRKMEIWLYDEFCWPSGHAKGLVTKDRGELAAELLYVERDGASRVERELDSANMLLPQATDRFLAVTHERYAAAVGEYFGNTIRAIFTDEPSLALQHKGRAPGDTSWRFMWSDVLSQALGGDFRQRLAAAGEKVAESPLWREYWAAYAKVFHEAWTQPIARWSKAHNIAMSGHLLGENDFGSHVTNYGGFRRQLDEFHIPGIDEIFTRWEVDRYEAMTLAAIAEYPRRERMVEVFALGPCDMHLETMRKMVDVCSVCGVDRYVMAICPHDLSGNFTNRKYLGVHGVQQPWFRDYARVWADYLAETAERARQAQPLGVPWPAEEELWEAAGPSPRQSARLREMTKTFSDAAREVIRQRVASLDAERLASRSQPASADRRKLEATWMFEPVGMNSLRLDGPTLDVVQLPKEVELSVQSQLVRGLRVNGTAINLAAAPADAQFDLSYRRVSIGNLLKEGENTFEVETDEPDPLPFLPSLVLWGRFAVDEEGRLVAPPETISLGDWRRRGYPMLWGVGRYRAEVDWLAAPTRLGLDSFALPARVVVNGRECGRRPWAPFEFELAGAARPGRNDIVIEVAGTLGHLLIPKEACDIGLMDVWVA